MTDQIDEDAVRARAYQLWEESGRGHGNHEDHWRRAEAEHGAAAGEAALTADEVAGVPGEAERHVDGVSPIPASGAEDAVTGETRRGT